MSKQWLQFVQLYSEKHPDLSHKQVLQEAKYTYEKLKEHYRQKGGDYNDDIAARLKSRQNPLIKTFYTNIILTSKQIGNEGVEVLAEVAVILV